jgi:hypothetical protein
MTRYQDMTPAERAETTATITRMEAERPEGEEAEICQHFNPGVVFFQDGQYRAVSPDIESAWPFIEFTLQMLLRLLPHKFRLEYVREGINKGAVIPLAFVENGKAHPFDAGLISCEMSDDGKRVIWVPVCSFSETLNLDHASKIAEIAALALGAEQVRLWTPKAVPVLEGYRVENCWSGQMQIIDIEPIQ